MSEEEKLIEEKTENKTKDLTDEMLEDKNSALYKDTLILSELVNGLLDGSLKIVKE